MEIVSSSEISEEELVARFTNVLAAENTSENTARCRECTGTDSAIAPWLEAGDVVTATVVDKGAGTGWSLIALFHDFHEVRAVPEEKRYQGFDQAVLEATVFDRGDEQPELVLRDIRLLSTSPATEGIPPHADELPPGLGRTLDEANADMAELEEKYDHLPVDRL